MSGKKYTQAQKLAYYKKLATGKKSTYTRRPYRKRRQQAVKGYGDYTTYGGKLGSRIGKDLGGFVGNGIQTLLGFGDYVKPGYNVAENSLLSMGNDPPMIHNAKDGRVILRHREFLQDVITGPAGSFKVNSYKINPGLETSFPWLAQVAQAFGQYKMRGMIFEFKSMSAEALNSTNTALGTVVLCTEYNADLPNFTDKQQMENHQYSVSARQSSSVLHPIECARDASVMQQLYIRTGSVPEGTDSRLYDFGNFQIATVGQQASNVNIGELWVTYEIELLKPQINEVGSVQNADFYRQNTSGGITTTTPFGDYSSMTISSANSLGTVIENIGSQGRITFPQGFRGCFEVLYYVDATSSICSGWSNGNDAITFTQTPLAQVYNSGSVAGANITAVQGYSSGQSSSGDAPFLYFALPAVSSPTGMRLYITAIKDGMGPDTFVPYPLTPFISSSWEAYKREQENDLYLKWLESRNDEVKSDEPVTSVIDQLSESTSEKLQAYLKSKQ